jgi:hypothetical protein
MEQQHTFGCQLAFNFTICIVSVVGDDFPRIFRFINGQKYWALILEVAKGGKTVLPGVVATTNDLNSRDTLDYNWMSWLISVKKSPRIKTPDVVMLELHPLVQSGVLDQMVTGNHQLF